MVFGQVPSGWLGIHNEICFKLVREILDEICFEVGLREMEKQGLAFQNIISLSLSLSLSLSISLSVCQEKKSRFFCRSCENYENFGTTRPILVKLVPTCCPCSRAYSLTKYRTSSAACLGIYANFKEQDRDQKCKHSSFFPFLGFERESLKILATKDTRRS